MRFMLPEECKNFIFYWLFTVRKFTSCIVVVVNLVLLHLKFMSYKKCVSQKPNFLGWERPLFYSAPQCQDGANLVAVLAVLVSLLTS
jgi:hypothetical protein